ncbi:MAG: alpha/beta fold hydrolase, partial [Pseudomonadota bacterium]
MKPVLLLAFATLLIASLAGCFSIPLNEDFVFRPPNHNTRDRTDLSVRWEEVFEARTDFTYDINADGETARFNLEKGQLIPARVWHGYLESDAQKTAWTIIERGDPTRPLIVHCGGNATDRYGSAAVYGIKLIDFGDAYLYDYPGYGDSTGEPTVDNVQAVGKAVAEHVSTFAGPDRPVVLWGHSLGGFICSDLVQHLPRLDGMIFEASARNADSVAKGALPLLIRPFLRLAVDPMLNAFDNVKALEGFEGLVLVLGAKKDRTLPVGLSRSLADDLKTAGGDVTYVEFDNANHVSISTQDKFCTEVSAFFERIADYTRPE